MFLLPRLIPLLFVVLTLLTAVGQAAEPPDLESISLEKNVVNIETNQNTLIRLTFLDSNLLRIQATDGREFVEAENKKAPIVLPWTGDLPVVKVSNNTIKTSALEIVVHTDPLRLELRRLSDGRTLWQELKPLIFTENRTVQTLASDPAEKFLGGGQQNGTFEFKGRLMEISYSGGWEEGDRPSPAPFYMSDRGYGMLRNTWADGQYDFRSDGYSTCAHQENRFDAYCMVGDSIHQVLDLYTRLTGRAALLPRWAFEYGDADCYNDGDNSEKPGTVPEGWSDGPTGTTLDVVASVAEMYRHHDMPGGWILPNDGYGCGYEDLPEVVARLQELGFKTGLWTENGVEKIAWEVGTAGTRVQKLDVAWTGKGYQWALDANHDAAQGFLDNSDSRPFIWTVMGWAGIQRYAVTWTGDQSGSWDYIRWHVPTLIGSGLSGMNYSTGDVDGIFGGSPETFMRDLQWKSFTPVLMGMSGWSKSARKHPWWFDEPYRSINRRYLKLRQRLMPFIYTLARETETSGAPMVRGLMWDHPNDPEAFEHPYQFFLGRDLLVAPVYRSQASSDGWRENVYLPEGQWVDYWSGQLHEAGPQGKLIDVPVDLATLPVLVRAGAIIPMHPESLFDGQVPADPLTLDIYPSGQSEFVLYEDDGNTRDYLDGAFSEQVFQVTDLEGDKFINIAIGAAEGNFDGQLEQRNFEILLHTGAPPKSLRLDGVDIPARADSASYEQNPTGWYFNSDYRSGVVFAKTGQADTRKDHELVFEFDREKSLLPGKSYPQKPAGDGTVDADDLMVVGRSAEEPGHVLENAFDGNLDTWFRTVRDQSVTYGPHEFTLSLGGRRVIEGFRISPRNDKYWKYGQVRRYEVYLADVNGMWGEPIATGVLEQTEEQQEVMFAPRAGRLLRFRVMSTHDDGVDPMILNASEQEARSFDALTPDNVGPTTISEFHLLERATPAKAPLILSFCSQKPDKAVQLNGLRFDCGLAGQGSTRHDFRLSGNWHTFAAEVGIGQPAGDEATARFQLWGDEKLLWDSGTVGFGTIIKPRLDIRGLQLLSLRAITSDPAVSVIWADPVARGYQDDSLEPVERP